MADRKILKSLFIDDPEMMRVIEQREQTDMLRQMSEKKIPNISEVLGILEAREQTGLLREIAANKQLMKGEKGDSPIKGIDYLTEEELQAIKDDIAPIKGVHYFDGQDGKDGLDADEGKIILTVLSKIKLPKDGKSVSKSETKAMLSGLIEELEAKDFGAVTETDVENIAKRHSSIVHDKLSQSIATLRGDVMRNYGGHGGTPTTTKMEIPVGAVDGLNTVFTVSHAPVYIEVSGQIMVSQTQDPTQYGYTYSSPTVTFVNAPTQTPHSFYNG